MRMTDDDRFVVHGGLPSIKPVGSPPKENRIVLDLPEWMFPALEARRQQRGLRSRVQTIRVLLTEALS